MRTDSDQLPPFGGETPFADNELEMFLERSEQLLRYREGQVEVERQGKWFVLEGTVDSHRTRSQLFSLVPRKDGAQWIVDRIRVGVAS
ncbi:MAG: hypothetical protein R6V85_04260 [Polyangia bacterium]